MARVRELVCLPLTMILCTMILSGPTGKIMAHKIMQYRVRALADYVTQ